MILEDDDFARAMDAVRPDVGLNHPRLREAASLLDQGRFVPAERIACDFLKTNPQDVSALRLLAEILIRLERRSEAENLLVQCLQLAPQSAAARFAYANVLLSMNKAEAALIETETLLKQQSRNPLFRSLKPLVLEAIGKYSDAATLWRELTQDYPARVECWLRLGYALRAVGDRDDCVAAFRMAIHLNPTLGEAYWALGNLKTLRFTESDISEMETQLASAALESTDRVALLFSLGKAYADQALHPKSFSYYAKANALQRLTLQYDPDVLTDHVRLCKEVFTPQFFRGRAGMGCPDASPIFIVGMLRSGSTLVEQILASHSQVEGTAELTSLDEVQKQIQRILLESGRPNQPSGLATLSAEELREFGERYMRGVQPHRKLQRPRFTDKMGANFVHAGLLQLILPNAKIVDVRRHPLACGWSNFTQLFPAGQNFTYRLADMGRLYRDYVELMAHFDGVLPGKVHRIFYERLVADPRTEVVSLLDYLGLPFEEGCLSFHETERALTTVSSEQVRKPIYQGANDEWHNFEPWLGPLKSALGPVAERYPYVPDFD
ncbi:MAG: sulfotransferase [Alphaproteobacteria bacterium]|nr:sulfotransferase [Alphaproteobacteria bacterium]